jgi:Ca-activated chloride channel family protein
VPTVVGPRFVPPAGVPDADRITPPVTPEGTRAGHDLSIAADIVTGVPIGDVTAPLHAIDVERPAPDRVRVRLRQSARFPTGTSSCAGASAPTRCRAPCSPTAWRETMGT